MTKFDYKSVAYFLIGAILGCGFHEIISRMVPFI